MKSYWLLSCSGVTALCLFTLAPAASGADNNYDLRASSDTLMVGATTTQPEKPASSRPVKRSLFHQALDDGFYLTSQPDFYIVMGALGAAPLVFRSSFANESVALNNRLHNSPGADRFFEQGEWIGQASLHIGASLVSMGVGKLAHSSALQSFGSDLFRAQGFSGVITLSMKVITDRTRPDGSPYSYPSGHTSTSFASAGVIYSHFGKVWGAAAFLGATYVGISRIEENKHYLSDVLSGAIIGSYVGLKIANRSKNRRGPTVSIVPDTRFKNGGLSLALRF